jgi:hypothetical protein
LKDRNATAIKGDVTDLDFTVEQLCSEANHSFNRIVQHIHDSKTELLKAFRIAELEANEGAFRSRLATIEDRILEVEKHLNIRRKRLNPGSQTSNRAPADTAARRHAANSLNIGPNLKINASPCLRGLQEILTLVALPGTNTCHYSHSANQPHYQNNNHDGSNYSVSKHSGFSFQSGPGYWPTTFSTCPNFF